MRKIKKAQSGALERAARATDSLSAVAAKSMTPQNIRAAREARLKEEQLSKKLTGTTPGYKKGGKIAKSKKPIMKKGGMVKKSVNKSKKK